MSKKIMIVTVYNSENCGSFLQAYAMKIVLEKLGFEVTFYKRNTKGTSHSVVKHLLSTGKMILSRKFKQIRFVWEAWYSFEKRCHIFKNCDMRSKLYREIDYVLLGSDTIWNFDSFYFRKKSKVYLGNQFENKNVISYAASVANTSEELFDEIVDRNGGLNHLSYCMVRDSYTKKMVEKKLEKNVHIVVDPTLLLEKEDYLKLIPNKKIFVNEKKYLLLYYFGELGESLKNEIRKYANEKKLKIISFLVYRNWCDESISPDPINMLFYFNHAESIITNTFHGSIFSMIFEKPFAVHNEGKKKVNNLLVNYGQEERLFVDSTTICEILDCCKNAVEVESLRKDSLDKLCEALNIENIVAE